ncbi:MAG: hypothetical protein M0R77_10355 [Gammaproteobacteria bacterium]|jgi:hypothetical protein|nr:hypothetical protein [Gammaproteobacteria bacterium]
MVGMREKLKDVELHPYMLAIYKDNEHRHLLKHALECWEHRTVNGTRSALRPLDTNPILYCRFPPLDLIHEYNLSSSHFLGSRILQCPVVARWALEQFLTNWSHDPDMVAYKIQSEMLYFERVSTLIKYDDELIYKIIMAGIGPVMPSSFHQTLSEDQKMAMTICA